MSSSKLPDFIDCPASWLGTDMVKQPSTWSYNLNRIDLAEIKQALKMFENTGLTAGKISKSNFPLPQFSVTLNKIRSMLIEDIGFYLIRGLPLDEFTRRQCALIFLGFGVWMGKLCSQNAKGHLLGHVRDTGASSNNTDTRIYQTNERQTFHTDSADVVGLLCLQSAKRGGDSLLVSATTIYNQFRKERLDLIDLLFEPIATDRRGEIPEGMKPYFMIPIFSWFQKKLTVMYQRQYIDSAQRFSDVGCLSKNMIEALDLFDEIANRKGNYLTMSLQPGDIQFVHNHSLLHDRTGFIDSDDDQRQRHLLRVWLSINGDRILPDVFSQRFGSIRIGNRGGIEVPGTKLMLPIDE